MQNFLSTSCLWGHRSREALSYILWSRDGYLDGDGGYLFLSNCLLFEVLVLSATIFPTYWNYFLCSVYCLYFIMSIYVMPNCIALIQSSTVYLIWSSKSGCWNSSSFPFLLPFLNNLNCFMSQSSSYSYVPTQWGQQHESSLVYVRFQAISSIKSHIIKSFIIVFLTKWFFSSSCFLIFF